MTSTLKTISSRATLYMAFPITDKSNTVNDNRDEEKEFDSSKSLGGLLEGIGPSVSDLSWRNLLGWAKS